MSRGKDRREITEIASRHGAVFDGHTAKGHLRWRLPSGRLVITVSKAETPRHIRNVALAFRQQVQRSSESGS